jgi:predicted phosphodiesterase
MFLELLQNPKLIDQMTKKYGNGIKYAVDKLGQNHINFIKNLRENKSFVIDDIKVLMAHGTPWDTNYYVYPNSKEKIFQRLANYNENYIFLGHTHIQMIKELNSTIIVNPGSVGQPRDAGNEAKWFILDTISKETKFIKTPYDVRNIIKQIKTYDPNKLSLIKYFEN